MSTKKIPREEARIELRDEDPITGAAGFRPVGSGDHLTWEDAWMPIPPEYRVTLPNQGDLSDNLAR